MAVLPKPRRRPQPLLVSPPSPPRRTSSQASSVAHVAQLVSKLVEGAVHAGPSQGGQILPWRRRRLGAHPEILQPTAIEYYAVTRERLRDGPCVPTYDQHRCGCIVARIAIP